MVYYEKYRGVILLSTYLVSIFGFVYFLVRSKSKEEYGLYWKGFLALSLAGSIVVWNFIARIPDSLIVISKIIALVGAVVGVYLIILGERRRKPRQKTRN